MPFLRRAIADRLEILRTRAPPFGRYEAFPMSPVAVLPKVVALGALLVCSAPSSPPDPEAISKLSAPKSIGLQCRRYFGCVPKSLTKINSVME